VALQEPQVLWDLLEERVRPDLQVVPDLLAMLDPREIKEFKVQQDLRELMDRQGHLAQ